MKTKALGSNPLKLGHVGQGKRRDIPYDRVILDGQSDQGIPVIPYDRTTIYVRADFLQWLQRRKHWDNVDITDSIEDALKDFMEKTKKEYPELPVKKRRHKRK